MKSLSVKTKLGWITAFEEDGNIIRVKFGKSKKNSNSKNLIKFKNSLNNFFKKNLIFLNLTMLLKVIII